MHFDFLVHLSRAVKRRMFFVADLCLVMLSLGMAFVLRYGTLEIGYALNNSWLLFPTMLGVGAALITVYGLPKIKLHAIENRAILRIAAVAATLAIAAVLISYILRLPTPRSVPLIFGALFFVSAVTFRMLALNVLMSLTGRGRNRTPVAIYGAGDAGIQLASALQQSVEVRPIAFVDDNPNLHNLIVGGLPVQHPSKLLELVKSKKIQRVLLAMPSAPKDRIALLTKNLSDLGVEVQVLPSFIEMLSGAGIEDSLRLVTPDDLLGRNKVDLNTPEIAKAYAGRVVMVTGAGGSIGSELCRQLVDCKPAQIVLFERSELALYSIDSELRPLAASAGIPVLTRLGSVIDAARVAGVIAEANVEIILHAAAYKHVPLVEENELEGARNNVLGTQIVADAAEAAGIERFILISTDKAVRPTNIMGATKRLAELVVQDRHMQSQGTRFSMVRFGNVLGSSGSVLPLFQKQIEMGGPLTVTHPEVTRFFMTIPEAARLVLLAGAYAQGGDVFVLDMGKPQKIVDIARKMIKLSGRRVKDPVTGVGDIAIEITGLRPGEKLYEELLIDDDCLQSTPHPKILRASENALSQIEVAAMLREVKMSVSKADAARLRRLIEIRVEGYQRMEAG